MTAVGGNGRDFYFCTEAFELLDLQSVRIHQVKTGTLPFLTFPDLESTEISSGDQFLRLTGIIKKHPAGSSGRENEGEFFPILRPIQTGAPCRCSKNESGLNFFLRSSLKIAVS